MKIRILLILVVFLSAFSLKAQPPETIYEGTLIASGFKQNIPLASDGPFPIGFSFTFFGNPYTQFYTSANGLVMFINPDGFYDAEVTIPASSTPNNYIAPFWDNLSIVDGGNVMYKTVGVAPNRKCIIQYKNMGFDPTPTALGTFQVILYETSNIIRIQYRLIVDPFTPKSHGESATIGLENSDGSNGALLAFHNGDAVHTEDAVTFTPSGPATYTVDSDALYDGVFLTTNLTLPDPGMVDLISPSSDAVIGSSHTFEWSAATNASLYYLVIDTLSNLSTASYYVTGSGLTYDITGLLLGKTYYWSVFSSNATALTWCEVQRFSTSSAPPLAPVPQTVWTEQLQDKTIKLQFTGGDASPKTAIITSLPVQGQLFQYNGGVRGSQITMVQATVTDADRNVIYYASGSSGNGVGNFNFKISDPGGESPEGTITVNVSPPGIPNVLYIAKNANVEIQLDRIMADPSGKQDQFTVTVNSVPVAINSASLKPGDSYTILLTLATALTGSETVLVSYTQGDVIAATGGFLLSFTDQTVNLTAQTITFTQSLTKKYGDSPFALSATASSGLGMTYSSSNLSVATISSNLLTIHTVGTSDITARQAGDATYAPARYIKTLTVSKGDQTITFNTLSAKTYGDADFTLSATASSGLSVSYTSGNTAVATVSGNLVHIVGAGTSIITASQTGNTLWNPAPDVQQTLTVNKADQTISFSALPAKTYGDADFVCSALASSGLNVGFSSDNTAVATITGNTIHIVGAGTAVITASQDGDLNYNAAPNVQQTLVVNKSDQTITFSALPAKTYGDADFVCSVSASSGLSVTLASNNPAIATIASGLIHIVGAGSAIITASQTGNSNYNTAPDVQQTLVVNKADQTTSFSVLPVKTYGDADFVCSVSASSGLSVTLASNNSAVATIASGLIHIVGAGSAIITASQAGNSNYNAAPDVQQTLVVNKADQTISFSVLPVKTYGDVDFTVSALASSGLSVEFSSDNLAVAVITGDTIHIAGAGSAVITASQDGDSNYNAAPDVQQTLVVNKADQTISFSVLPVKTYGDADFVCSALASSGLSVEFASDNPVVATITGNTIHIVGAGTAVITASQDGDSNYNAAPDAQQTLVVNKADQTITFNSLPAKAYGDADFVCSALTSSGLSVEFASDNPVVAALTGNTVHIAGAGTVVITASQDGDSNYNAAPDVSQTLTVSKADLTFTADNLSRDYLAGNPTLTYTISGFVPGDTQALLDVLPGIRTTATQNSPAGTYPVTLSGGSDDCYNYIFISGILTIYRFSQTIVFTDIPEKLLVNDIYTLAATSTSGMEVLFESMDPTIATVSGDQMTGASKGNVQIRAYNNGDQNYDPAEAFATVEINSTHKEILHLFTPNNDGFNDYWEIPGMSSLGKCEVRVFNRWGKLVFANDDYDNLWDGTSNGMPLPEGAYYFVVKTENVGTVKGTVNIVR